MTRESKYTQTQWDAYETARREGMASNEALRRLGIPRGSLHALARRFGPPVVEADTSHPPAALPDEPGGREIGDLAAALNAHTERLLELAAQMSKLTRHAHGLMLLDRTLGDLEHEQSESSGLRRRLAEAERQLIGRASVVHSAD